MARVGLAGIAVFTPSALVADAAGAESPGCYGDYCSGSFPDQVGCAEDARTVYEQPVTRPSAETSTSFAVSSDGTTQFGIEIHPGHEQVGVLEVRESAICGTKWARLSTFRDQDVSEIRFIQADGYETTYDASPYLDVPGEDPAGIFFTPQIFDKYQVRAEVEAAGTDAGSVRTPWIG